MRYFTLQVHVTSACDAKCAHCYQRNVAPCHMGKDDYRLLMDQLVDLRGSLESQWESPVVPIVAITGGEPMLHLDFRELVMMAWKRRFEVAVLTNGHFIDRDIAEFLRGTSFVQVSLDGDQATHDAIRGAGDYKRALDAVRVLSKAGVYTMVSFTAHAGNYRTLPAAARASRRAGARRFWSDRYLPIGDEPAFQPLDTEQTREWLALLGAAANKKRSIVARHRALQFMYGGHPYSCHAGRDLLAVTEQCEVLACRRLPLTCGDFRDTPLAEAYESSRDLQALRNFEAPETCAGCDNVTNCAGGLRCLSAAVAGDWRVPDPGCPVQAHLTGFDEKEP